MLNLDKYIEQCIKIIIILKIFSKKNHIPGYQWPRANKCDFCCFHLNKKLKAQKT